MTRRGRTKTELIRYFNSLIVDDVLKLSLCSPIKKGHVLMLIQVAEGWQKSEHDRAKDVDSRSTNS